MARLISYGRDEQQLESVGNDKIEVFSTKKPLFFYVQDPESLIGRQILSSLHSVSPEGVEDVERLSLSAMNAEDSNEDPESFIGKEMLPSLHSFSPEGVEGVERLSLSAMNAEDSDEDFEGMDTADLPPVDENWSPMDEFEEMTWDTDDEEEKACSDRTMASTSGTPIFSKVFTLGMKKGSTYVAIPKTCKTTDGSPTKVLFTKPTMLDTVANATQRIRIKYKDKAGHNHLAYATGFAVSPTMVMTARHVLNKEDIMEIRAHGGISALANNFETDVAFEGSDVHLARRACSKAKDKDGLFIHGADVGCFKIQGDCESFLLPCSATMLSTHNVVILSYPAVDNFLKRAKKELVKEKSEGAVIWKQYWPTMKSFYENSIKEHADAQGMRVAKARTIESITTAACKKAKESLYTELENTFMIAHTGSMVCSVGDILCANKACIGTSCSTLVGSSGAAVCPLERPGNVVGIQRGGSSGFDLNLTTSTDNHEFVEFYMTQILPSLPHPNDNSWARRNTDGFHKWLCLHNKHIPRQSPWHVVLGGSNSVFIKSLKRKCLLS